MGDESSRPMLSAIGVWNASAMPPKRRAGSLRIRRPQRIKTRSENAPSPAASRWLFGTGNLGADGVGKMTNRTSRGSGKAAPRPRSHAIGTAVHRRPVTKLLTIEETAEVLNASPRTVRRAIDAGALPVHRIGRLVRISEA